MNYETTVETGHDGIPGDVELPEHQADKKRRKVRIAIALAALAVLALVLWMLTRGQSEGELSSGAEQAPSVSVTRPGQTAIEGEIVATGALAARREMPVGVVGEGGRVVTIPVEPGQWVRAGQVLAVIDRSVQNQQLEGAAAQIKISKADAELAQANLDRALKLVERGFISKADVDRLTATRDAAVARVALNQAQYRELAARNARLNIVSPAAGLVLERNIEPGEVVSPGTGALFSIAKGGEMEMLAQLGETELSGLTVGAPASVTPVGTDKSFPGKIWQISPVIDPKDRMGTVRIALSYAPGLRPGGFATANIDSGTVTAPLLPESAILNDEKGSYVFVVGPDNKVQRRPIKTGMVTENGIAVASGLDGSERVVLRAGGFLASGDEIKPKLVKN